MRNRLLSVVSVALLVAHLRIAAAAPQPFDLLRTTTVSSSGLDVSRTEGLGRSTTLRNSNLEFETSSVATSSEVNSESTEEIHESSSSMENKYTVTIAKESDDSTRVPTTASSDESFTDIAMSTINKDKEESNDTKTELVTENDEKDSEISISRYVPPLDPMKHMLMMAEVKKQLEVSNVPEITSTIPTAIIETMLVEKASSADSSTESVTESENVSGDSERVEIFTVPTEKENDGTSEYISSKMQEQTTTNLPSTLKDNEVKLTKESVENAPDINHESSILIKSSELFSGKEDTLNTELSTESKESVSTETSDNSTDFNNSSILSNSFTTISSEMSSTDLPIVNATIKLEEITTSASDLEDESNIREMSEDDEIESLTTEKFDSTIEENIPEENSSASSLITSSLATILDLISSNASQLESTTELTELVKLASHSESIDNLTYDHHEELKESMADMNTSSVNSDGESETTSTEIISTKEIDGNSSEASTADIVEKETTIGMFTTLKELLFSTTVTPIPMIHKIGNEDIFEEISEEGLQSESITSNSSFEVMKGELLKSDITNISSSDIDITTTTTVSELNSEITIVIENGNQSQTTTISDNSENLKTQETHLPETTANSETSTTMFTLKSGLTNSSHTESTLSITTNSPTELYVEALRIPVIHDMNTQDRYISGNNFDTVAAVQFLHNHDKSSSEQCFKLVNAHWNYATNLTEENKKKQLEQTLEYALFHKEAWKNATSYAWKSFNDTLLRRWFKSLSVLGTAALPEEKLNEFNRLKAEMKNIYSTAKVCEYDPLPSRGSRDLQKPKDCTLTLEPDLQRILTRSRDYDELTYVWQAWRDVAGKPLRERYLRFVELSNEAARLNGFSDTGDMWREAYESDTFEADLEELWNQLKPLYENLHAFVRRRLINEYGSIIKDDGPIPAHLFGNMWAQSWVSLLDITQPFPGKPSVDVTPIMESKNLSAVEMFKISEEFFTSLGLKAMPEEFWKHSLIEKPTDREIICHASAWDFCNGKDYRIKQCTDITMEDLITVHHEMGHIQYFLQYARQPNVFREGANPGFHEAIGDVLALSVSTPKHLQSIGLLEEVSDDPEGDLNFLLRTALDKVSFLPSGYLIDQWRWGLFNGDIKPEEMNTKWWDLRLKYQGICPPVKRHDTDFDPGAKYHVPGNVPYIRYFVSFVIQFQFHKVLCDASGHTGPLYKCDIYRSKEAGQILSQVMELGSSEHWSEAMKIMTGGDTNRMDAGPILEYFQPLLDFLVEQNNNETLGWKSDDSTICP